VKIITPEASTRVAADEIIPRPLFDIPKLRSLGLALATVRAIARTEADLVHVHFAHGLGAWLSPAATGRPLVVSVMGGDVLFDERGRTAAERRLTTRLLQNADLITAKAGHLADVARHLAPGVRCETVIWGVDTQQFRPLDGSALRHRLGFAPSDLLILSPKALQPLYNAHLLVEALSSVVAEVPAARLVLIDHVVDSAYRAELVARIETLGLQAHVRFLPPVPHDQMAEHYAIADVIASVPSSDGMPQSLLEALACARVNLLPASSRYEELITDGESAVMVALNPPDIAATLTRLLTEPELRQRIAENGRRLVVERADFDREVGRVEGFYRELVRGPRRRSLRKRAGLLAGTLKDLFAARG
jgi:glycosyltransferase involved in cell wall biosynthesis